MNSSTNKVRIARTNIVVISFNALPYTKATLSSLFLSIKNKYHLTIVDNGSDSDTQNYLDNLKTPRNCVSLTIIRNKTNTGVTHAYNQGFQVSIKKGVDFTCFCNNDLYFSSDWLNKLEKYLDSHSNIAMVNPLRPSTSTMYTGSLSTIEKLYQSTETDNWVQELEEFSGVAVSQFNNFSDQIAEMNCELYKSDEHILRFPDSLSTCVCLARNEVFKKLNNFADPVFKDYGGEDIDTCWSVMELGYDCAIYRRVYIHHFRGKSLKINGLDRKALLSKSNALLYSRWKDKINKFIHSELTRGINVKEKLAKTTNNEYWLLSQLDRSVDILKGFQQ